MVQTVILLEDELEKGSGNFLDEVCATCEKKCSEGYKEFCGVLNGDEGVDVEKIKENFITSLNTLTDRYFYSEAKAREDYLNMGEIIYDAQAGDPDAIFLKQFYGAILAKEEELEKQLEEMTLDQLLELDLEAWAREQYDAVKAELEAQQNE